VAWDTFRNRDGCSTFDEFSRMIFNYRNDRQDVNPTIGCIILTDPIFFNEDDWIETPKDWSNSIVQGKGYETTYGEGIGIWEKVDYLINSYRTQSESNGEIWSVQDNAARYGYGNSYKYRVGQGAFRVLVTEAYDRRCAITGEKTLPVLEAAHIRSFSSNGPNKIANGLLLRSDLHKLFDGGYVTITKDYKIEISSRIRIEFQNGKEYYKFHGENLRVLPNNPRNIPDFQFIDWHNTNIFKP
jgi:putative restriction endonuclease